MLILGIDPGSQHTGYGFVEVEHGRETLVAQGTLHLDTSGEHQDRLKELYDRLSALVEANPPDECAVEMPVYGKNPQSMLKLGRAQAAAMLVALNRQIPVTQYTPTEIKKAVTGNGGASKEQVGYMVRTLLKLPADVEMGLDASDALAVALCHAHRRAHGSTRQHKNWAAFIRDNPGRVR